MGRGLSSSPPDPRSNLLSLHESILGRPHRWWLFFPRLLFAITLDLLERAIKKGLPTSKREQRDAKPEVFKAPEKITEFEESFKATCKKCREWNIMCPCSRQVEDKDDPYADINAATDLNETIEPEEEELEADYSVDPVLEHAKEALLADFKRACVTAGATLSPMFGQRTKEEVIDQATA